MGDNGRRRRSMWDVEEDTQPLTEITENRSWPRKDRDPSYDGGRYREFSASKADNTLRHKYHSRVTSWEDQDDSIGKDKLDISARKRVENDGYYKSKSPGLDGSAQQNWSHSPENQWSQSRRYTGKGRSRSRSRGRGKSRSRSRSWSRGGNRGRGWSRSRSRSRSRGIARDQTRSRSPYRDQRRELYQSSDRSIGSGRLSCRDFAVGKCRRGSHCKFLHLDDVSHRDEDHSENNLAGRWSRLEPELGSKNNYDRPREKLSDAYYGEDEPLRNRSRGTVTCRDFMKGNCRFGAACRFSHHGASENDNYHRGFRNAPFDPDPGHQQSKAEKPLCKFFLAGKCNRDNCRFSHDCQTPTELEDGTFDKNGGQGLSDLNKWSNGPTWDDTATASNTRRQSEWGQGAADMDISQPISVEQRSNKSWGHRLGNDTKVWGSPEREDKGFSRDKYHTFARGDGNNGGVMGTAKSMAIENPFDKQEDNLICQDLHSHDADRFSPNVHGRNISEQASGQYLSTSLKHSIPSADSYMRQPQALAKCDSPKAFGSGAVYEVKDSGNTIQPVLDPGQSVKGSGGLYEVKDSRNTSQPVLDTRQSVNQNNNDKSMLSEHSSVSNGIDLNRHMLSPIAIAHDVNLSGPGQHVASPLNFHSQIQSHQQALTIPDAGEPNITHACPTVGPNEQVAPTTTASSHLTRRFVIELKAQSQTALDPSHPMELVPSCPDTAHFVSIHDTLTNSVRPMDQYNLVNDGIKQSQSGNSILPPGMSSYLNGLENLKPMELLSSLSTIISESAQTHQTGAPEVECHEGAKLKQHETTENSEVKGNGEVVALGSKAGPENICSDGQGKDEDDSGNKNDKAMRLFKIALVEFVKEILKPTWKEGRMSREVHKNVVKKVVDKVTSTIRGEHVPKTQDRIEQYLSCSKPKITKLAQAYVERNLKPDS